MRPSLRSVITPLSAIAGLPPWCLVTVRLTGSACLTSRGEASSQPFLTRSAAGASRSVRRRLSELRAGTSARRLFSREFFNRPERDIAFCSELLLGANACLVDDALPLRDFATQVVARRIRTSTTGIPLPRAHPRHDRQTCAPAPRRRRRCPAPTRRHRNTPGGREHLPGECARRRDARLRCVDIDRR